MKRLFSLLLLFTLCSCNTTLENGGVAANKNTFTIEWRNWDGTLLEIDYHVPKSSLPEYNGKLPQKNGDEIYDYSFSGWTPSISAVYGDATYYAEFTQSKKKYELSKGFLIQNIRATFETKKTNGSVTLYILTISPINDLYRFVDFKATITVNTSWYVTYWDGRQDIWDDGSDVYPNVVFDKFGCCRVEHSIGLSTDGTIIREVRLGSYSLSSIRGYAIRNV